MAASKKLPIKEMKAAVAKAPKGAKKPTMTKSPAKAPAVKKPGKK
jgi:hypothetical protein